MDKGAIELSVNFLVVLILSLAIFGFGIVFIYNLAGGAESLKDLTLTELDSRIADLKCQGNQILCLSQASFDLKPKDLVIVGLKIRNVVETEDFYITAELGSYLSDGAVKDIPPNAIKILPENRKEKIGQNQEANLGIALELDKGAQHGTYIINVDVYKGNSAVLGNKYDKQQKVYVYVD
ncbi:hypothetical protein J4401_02000 [Candidatus Woesearchaeota archaeon]|nr:hypothetical protein [Candidatus Woesearchaeota archaeon]